MEDRMHRFDNKLSLYPEIQERLQRLVKTSVCTAVHVFSDAKDIPDKVDLRLVVLDPDHGHKRKDPASLARKAAEAILSRHGDKPREYQNRVLFLVPDANAASTLRDHVRRYLAWGSIVKDAGELNLDKHHEAEANKNLVDARSLVDGSLRETYRYLLVPMQEVDAESKLSEVLWEDETLALPGSTYDKAIEAATRDREWVIRAWAPPHLAALLAKWFWKDDKPAVGANKVWLDACKYLYLPRLQTSSVFVQTIKDGLPHESWFAYAAAEKEPGKYEGLLFGASGGVYLDEGSLLIRPDAAAAAAKPVETIEMDEGDGESDSGSTDPSQVWSVTPATKARKPASGPPPYATLRRFHGTVSIDPHDPIGTFTEVVENVIAQFSTQYGTQVTITVDVEAKRSSGFDAKMVRVVRENAAVLKFKTGEFEED